MALLSTEQSDFHRAAVSKKVNADFSRGVPQEDSVLIPLCSVGQDRPQHQVKVKKKETRHHLSEGGKAKTETVANPQ